MEDMYSLRIKYSSYSCFFVNFAVTMRRLLLFYILLFCAFLPIAAQKKEIAAAKDQVKAGRDLPKAEQSMVNLLKDSANRSNEKIWNVLFESLQKQYNDGNEKLYLKQKYDTASLFNIASRMFTYMEAYDSIDAMPDKKGRVKLKMRSDNASKLNQLRPNLYNGGIYFLSKQNYKDAYKLFDQYISTAEEPMFKNYNYATKDKHLPQAAYWAVFCGYKLQDAKKVYHHTYLAMKDTAHNEPMLQYLAATYILDKDTSRCVETLTEGFKKYPRSDFFFPHLIDYYSKKKDFEKALSVTDYALKADSTSKTAWITKSTVLLNIGDYDRSLAISDSILKVDSTMAEAWLNSGLARFNKGVALDKNNQTLRKKRQQILELYKDALPYIEQYRKLCPKASDKWALPLYTIYLNLNMGSKFDEIDKILNK